MKVKCIDNELSCLENGRVYDVEVEEENIYVLKQCVGNRFNKDRFEIVEDNIEREYTINEIYELGGDFEFANGVNVYRFSGSRIEYKASNGWRETVKGMGYFLRTKFILVKKDKQVDFIEAMKAFEDGKTIKVEFLGSKKNEKIVKEIEPIHVKDEYCVRPCDCITPYLALHGTWFIKA